MKLKKITIYIVALTFFVFPFWTIAQQQGPSNPPIKIDIPNPTSQTDLMSLITAIINNIVMPIAAVAVVMYIIYAGFTYVTAQGNPTKVALAHQRLLWSLVGAGILLGAAGISLVVQNTIKALIN